MHNAYQACLDRLLFDRLHDNYFANEIRSARREAAVEDMANKISDEVIAGNSQRREAWAEEIVDCEAWQNFLRDLLDDVNSGIDPSDTIKRRVKSWALDVAAYELERGEHD
mgnify:CR=1 FL=1